MAVEITNNSNTVVVKAAGIQGPRGPVGNDGAVQPTGSFATTGSNSFVGDQIITGSLTVSGSSTFTNIGTAIFSGSITATAGITGSFSGTATSASFAVTASHALFAVSASHEITFEVSSSHAQIADSASGLFGTPSIVVNDITASGNISGSTATIFSGNRYNSITGFRVLQSSTDVLLNSNDFPILSHDNSATPILTTIGSDDIGGSNLSQIHLITDKGEILAVSGSTVTVGPSATNHGTEALNVIGNISSSGDIIGGGLNINGTTTFNDGDITNVGQIQCDFIVDDATNGTGMNLNSSDIRFRVAEALNVFTIGASGNVTASGNISASGATITALTGSFNHIITDDDTIEFRNKSTGVQTGRLKFDSSTGLNVQDNTGARTKIRAGRGEFLSLEAGPVGFNSLGSITASANISASGNIIANNLSGTNTGDQDLSNLVTNAQTASFVVNSQTGSFVTNAQTASFAITGSNVLLGNITSSGNISASGDIYGSSVYIDNKKALDQIVTDALNINPINQWNEVRFNRAQGGKPVTIFGNLTASKAGLSQIGGNIQAAGNISASGDITGNSITATSASLKHITNLTGIANDNIIVKPSVTFRNAAQFDNGIVGDAATGNSELKIGTTGFLGNTVSVNLTGNLTASGNISASGNITASKFNANSTAAGGAYQISGKNALARNSSLDRLDINVDGDFGFGVNIGFQGEEQPAQPLRLVGNVTASGGPYKFAGLGGVGNTQVNVIGQITASGDISSSGDVFGVTGSFSHLVGNSPITVGDRVTFQQPITAEVIDTSFETFFNFEAATAFTYIAPFGLTVNFTGSSTASMGAVGFVTASANTDTFSSQQPLPITLNQFDKLKITPAAVGLFIISGSRTI